MSGAEFYDRLCEALCSVATMQRAGLLLYDEARKLVVPVGSHGLDAAAAARHLRHARGDADRPGRPVRGPRGRGQRRPRALGARPLRRPDRHQDAHLHPGLRRRALAGRDLRRPRRRALRADRGRAPRDVDARQDRRARRERPHRHQPAGSRAPAPGAHRPRPRDPRARHAAAVRRLARARLGARPQRRGAPALRRRDAGGARRPARRARRARSRRARSTPAPPCATSWTGSAATTRTCRSSSTGSRASRCRTALEPLAQSVLAEALRNADKHADRRACACASAAATARSCSRCATTAPRSDTRGTGMGLRLAAVEALGSGAAWSSSAAREPTGACGWSSRCEDE